MRLPLLIAALACAPVDPPPPAPLRALPVSWAGGVYGLALPDGGIASVMLPDGGEAADDALVAVPCSYGGTLTGPLQLYSLGTADGVGRVVRGQYEWCAGNFSGDDLAGFYGTGADEHGFSAFLIGGPRGGLGVYAGVESEHEIRGIVSGLGLDGYRWIIRSAP